MAILVPQVAVDATTFLMGKGVSKDVAVGIVAVCYAGESALKPGSQGAQSTETPGALNPSGAYGICSWNGPRQQALQKFATEKGLPVGAVNTQLAFILTESANSYPKVWEAIQQRGITYAGFIPVFVEVYENPANPTAEIARAQTFAATLYPAIPSVAPGPVSTPAPSPGLVPPPVLTPLPSPISAPTSAAAVPIPIPSTSPATGVTMDPALAALITQVIEAVISGLVKTALASATPNVPVVSSTNVVAPVVNSGTSPLVPVANLEQIISGVVTQILPTLLAQVPKL